MTSRSSRMTKLQKEVLVNYLVNNRDLLDIKHSAFDIEKVNTKWLTLVEILNSLEGAKKSIKQWKDALNEFKSNVKRKARQAKGTRGIPKKDVIFSDSEERLLSLLSSIVVTRVKSLPEATGSTTENVENFQDDIIDDFEAMENTSQVSATAQSFSEQQEEQEIKLETTSTTIQDLGAFPTYHQNCMDTLAISNNNIAIAINSLARSFQKRNKQSSVFNLKF